MAAGYGLAIDQHASVVERQGPVGDRLDLRGDEAWLTVDRRGHPSPAELAAVLAELARRAPAAGATAVNWPTEHPDDATDAAADAAGLTHSRDLYQLRRSLPLEPSVAAAAPEVAVRTFRPGTADEEAWVAVNNRAFAHHPDQGRETIASLRSRLDEPWFDAAGFLVLDGDAPADRGGGLDGFCWTKIHPPTREDPAMGEIYVIGVDPDAHGRGLGRTLVGAGLQHLATRGLGTAMLYVDAENHSALRLYDRLGFTRHHVQRVYRSHKTSG